MPHHRGTFRLKRRVYRQMARCAPLANGNIKGKRTNRQVVQHTRFAATQTPPLRTALVFFDTLFVTLVSKNKIRRRLNVVVHKACAWCLTCTRQFTRYFNRLFFDINLFISNIPPKSKACRKRPTVASKQNTFDAEQTTPLVVEDIGDFFWSVGRKSLTSVLKAANAAFTSVYC